MGILRCAAQNVLFWCIIGHYSYDKIADHSGGSARVYHLDLTEGSSHVREGLAA